MFFKNVVHHPFIMTHVSPLIERNWLKIPFKNPLLKQRIHITGFTLPGDVFLVTGI